MENRDDMIEIIQKSKEGIELCAKLKLTMRAHNGN